MSMKRTVALLTASMILGTLSTSAILAWSQPAGTGLTSSPATAAADYGRYAAPLGSIDECTYEPDLAAWFVSGQAPERIQVSEYQGAFYKALRDMRVRYGLNSSQVKIAGLEVTGHSEVGREIKMTLRAGDATYVYDAAAERVMSVEPR